MAAIRKAHVMGSALFNLDSDLLLNQLVFVALFGDPKLKTYGEGIWATGVPGRMATVEARQHQMYARRRHPR